MYINTIFFNLFMDIFALPTDDEINDIFSNDGVIYICENNQKINSIVETLDKEKIELVAENKTLKEENTLGKLFEKQLSGNQQQSVQNSTDNTGEKQERNKEEKQKQERKEEEKEEENDVIHFRFPKHSNKISSL